MQKTVLTAIVALALFLMLPYAGSITLAIKLFKAQMQVDRKSAKGFENESLIVLDIPKEVEKSNKAGFIRIHAGEFILENQMYDIISSQDLGSVTRYVVYPDHKETKLKRKIGQKMAENGRKPLNKYLEQLFSFQWICPLDHDMVLIDTSVRCIYSDKAYVTHKSHCRQSGKPPESLTIPFKG